MDAGLIPVSTKETILGGLLYFRKIREAYLAMVGGNHTILLDENREGPYASVERTIQLFIRADIDVSYMLIMRRLLEDASKLPPANVTYKAQYLDIFSRLDKKEEYSEQICERFLAEVNKYLVVQSVTDELRKMHSVPQLQSLLTNANSKLSSVTKPGKLVFYDPVAAAAELMKHRDKVPTGISFFDLLTGGGIVWGEHGGCLAAPSGGKSVIANMLACNIAIQGYNTMILQFEQSAAYNSDFVSRVYSYLTGLPMSEFVNKDIAEISPEAKEALSRCAKVSSRIRIASFLDDEVDRSIETIISNIEASCTEGFTPQFVIIDWLGAVVSEFLAAASGPDNNYPLKAQEIQDRLNKYGKTKGISFFYLHQSSNEAAARESGYRPKMYDSYFFKGFAQKLEFCLQLGTKSSIGDGKFAFWCVAGKVRGAEPEKAVVVVMDGSRARIDIAKEGEFVVDRKGKIVPVQSMVSGDVDEVFTPSGTDAYINNFS